MGMCVTAPNARKNWRREFLEKNEVEWAGFFPIHSFDSRVEVSFYPVGVNGRNFQEKWGTGWRGFIAVCTEDTMGRVSQRISVCAPRSESLSFSLILLYLNGVSWSEQENVLECFEAVLRSVTD